MTNEQALLAIGIMALITAALRFAPFWLFSGKKTPGWLTKLGSLLPYAVMGMLVVYCLRGIRFDAPGHFLPELIAGAVVVGSYVWKRSTVASILAGTACYMLLIQLIFV